MIPMIECETLVHVRNLWKFNREAPMSSCALGFLRSADEHALCCTLVA